MRRYESFLMEIEVKQRRLTFSDGVRDVLVCVAFELVFQCLMVFVRAF